MLLLDEHYAPEIAASLRQRGHDVVTVAERPDLRGSADIAILAVAASEGRVVVTQNVRDFAALGARRLPGRKPHAGVVLVPRQRFRGSRSGFGLLIRALAAFLDAHAVDEKLTGRVVWLERASDEEA
jgi:predicted nuclease of predicted toxin-antitoxin system